MRIFPPKNVQYGVLGQNAQTKKDHIVFSYNLTDFRTSLIEEQNFNLQLLYNRTTRTETDSDV